MDTITFTRKQAGYWTITVNGTDRPVAAVRDGRNWVVQAGSLVRQTPGNRESTYGRYRNLRDAKSIMVTVWLAADAARELARYEAMEHELSRWNRLSRKIGVTFPIPADETPIARRVALARAACENNLRACGVRLSAASLMKAHGIK